MLTAEKAAANAANAQYLTGPKTGAGKARSSRNAVRHGLTSQVLVIREDERETFDEFEQGLREELVSKATSSRSRSINSSTPPGTCSAAGASRRTSSSTASTLSSTSPPGQDPGPHPPLSRPSGALLPPPAQGAPHPSNRPGHALCNPDRRRGERVPHPGLHGNCETNPTGQQSPSRRPHVLRPGYYRRDRRRDRRHARRPACPADAKRTHRLRSR